MKIKLQEQAPTGQLRPIKAMGDGALAGMSRTFAAAYAPAGKGGRPSLCRWSGW